MRKLLSPLVEFCLQRYYIHINNAKSTLTKFKQSKKPVRFFRFNYDFLVIFITHFQLSNYSAVSA